MSRPSFFKQLTTLHSKIQEAEILGLEIHKNVERTNSSDFQPLFEKLEELLIYLADAELEARRAKIIERKIRT